MEWYTILNALLDKNKISIIHTGLYHSNAIIKLLTENYKFKEFYSVGINDLNYNNNIISCSLLPNKINNKFGFI